MSTGYKNNKWYEMVKSPMFPVKCVVLDKAETAQVFADVANGDQCTHRPLGLVAQRVLQ